MFPHNLQLHSMLSGEMTFASFCQLLSSASALINHCIEGLSTLIKLEACQKHSCVCSLSIHSHCLRQTDALFLDVHHWWKDHTGLSHEGQLLYIILYKLTFFFFCKNVAWPWNVKCQIYCSLKCENLCMQFYDKNSKICIKGVDSTCNLKGYSTPKWKFCH